MNDAVRVIVEEDYDDMSRRGATVVTEHLRGNPSALLCAASGSSPLGLYAELAKVCAGDPQLFSALRVIKLDEWGPLTVDDPASCEFYVRTKVCEPLGVDGGRYITFRGDASDPEAECAAFASALQSAGPIDICILGMGVNGHVGMNEPADWLHETAHVAVLAKESQGHGMLANALRQPTYGMTLGMGDILRSRLVLLLVSGVKKREAMAEFMSRRISTRFPASLLWTHPNAIVIADRRAMPVS
ncbi:MAG: glucosamine-6-phosphate deaminase [Candidatus Hydrogenedentota bacterium]